MEGAQHEMAGERGLNRDLRRFQIAHFTHHDNVRVLAQEGAERLTEGHAHVLLNRHLHDAFNVVLDGVLGSQQLGINGVHAPQTRWRFSCPGHR